MDASAGGQSPTTVAPGQVQRAVDPLRLLPARRDLIGTRVEAQRRLFLSGTNRLTPVTVTRGGVIVDGHHAVRAAAEDGRLVDVLVTDMRIKAAASSIMSLPVR
jgi:hypothetical protein